MIFAERTAPGEGGNHEPGTRSIDWRGPLVGRGSFGDREARAIPGASKTLAISEHCREWDSYHKIVTANTDKSAAAELLRWTRLRPRGRCEYALCGLIAAVAIAGIFVIGSQALWVAMLFGLVWGQSLVMVYRVIRRKPPQNAAASSER